MARLYDLQLLTELSPPGAGPAECGFDCAHLWIVYDSGCGTFLRRVYPGFDAFK